jgi:hypothetical protein
MAGFFGLIGILAVLVGILLMVVATITWPPSVFILLYFMYRIHKKTWRKHVHMTEAVAQEMRRNDYNQDEVDAYVDFHMRDRKGKRIDDATDFVEGGAAPYRNSMHSPDGMPF